MDKPSPSLYVSEKHLEGTLAQLLSIQAYGHVARTFLLKQQDSLVQELRNGDEKYAKLTIQERDVLQTVFYADALDRLCLLIEDLSALLYALQGDLSQFVKAIVSQNNPNKVLKGLDSSKWDIILRYADLDSLPLSLEDKGFLETIRKRNIARLQGVVDLCSRFLELHWLFYTKHKHGNTVIYGFQKIDLNGEQTFILPAVYDTKQPNKIKGVIVNESIYQKWKTIMNGLVMMIHDLVERTTMFIERDGQPFAEYQIFYPLEPNENSRMEKIIQQCDASVKRTTITVHLQATAEIDFVQDFLDFYKKVDDFLIR